MKRPHGLARGDFLMASGLLWGRRNCEIEIEGEEKNMSANRFKSTPLTIGELALWYRVNTHTDLDALAQFLESRRIDPTWDIRTLLSTDLSDIMGECVRALEVEEVASAARELFSTMGIKQ